MSNVSDFVAQLKATPVGETAFLSKRLAITPIEKAGEVWYRAEGVTNAEGHVVMSRDPITAVSRAAQAILTGHIAI